MKQATRVKAADQKYEDAKSVLVEFLRKKYSMQELEESFLDQSTSRHFIFECAQKLKLVDPEISSLKELSSASRRMIHGLATYFWHYFCKCFVTISKNNSLIKFHPKIQKTH